MKKALLAIAVLLWASQGWCLDNFQFSAVAPSGQTLYYNIVGDHAELVAPWTNGSGSVGWDTIAKPTGHLIIPDSVTFDSVTYPVTNIAFAAFCFCRELTSVTFPATITSIANSAFHLCDALYSQTVPSTVTSIGSGAFNWVPMIFYDGPATGKPWGALCVNGYVEDSLYYTSPAKDTLVAVYFYVSDTVFVVPSTVTVIGNNALNSMTRITSLTIPSSVSFIGSQAFYGCTGLTEINSEGMVAPVIQDNTFTNVATDIPVNIPCGSIMSYYSRWSYFSNFVEDEGFTFSATSADENMGTVQVLTQPTCQAPSAVVNAVANEGYHFDHWNNGVTDNPYVLTVTDDTALVAYFVANTGIDDIDVANVNVYQLDGKVVVEGVERAMVSLYDIMGRKMSEGMKAESGKIEFSVPATGVYMVKVGTMPARRVVVVK